MNYNSIKEFNLFQVNVSILSPLKASENLWFANVSIQDKRGIQRRLSRLKAGAAAKPPSDFVQTAGGLGGAVSPPSRVCGGTPPKKNFWGFV